MALLSHNDVFVGHCRHISAPGDADAMHNGNLGDPFGGELRHVIENATKVADIL